MEWSDQGIIIKTKPFAEKDLVVWCFTKDHGLCTGLLKGGRGSHRNLCLQVGNVVEARWRGRLENHLGHFALESLEGFGARSAQLFSGRDRLLALYSLAQLVDKTLPERQAYPRFWGTTRDCLGFLCTEAWLRAYWHWEFLLLSELGYGLDLRCCVVCGTTEQLDYISPKTGKAACLEHGQAYHSQLLRLSSGLKIASADMTGGVQGVSWPCANDFLVTGYFLTRFVLEPVKKSLPEIRGQLLMGEESYVFSGD